MKRIMFILCVFACGFFACKQDTPTKTTSSTKVETKKPVDSTPKEIKISPFSKSPAFTDAAIKSMDFKNGKFNFGIGGTSYKLGSQTDDAATKMCANSDKGQHIHLIVDNGPYAAKYTSEFDYKMEDGSHYLLAFLSRSYHESIKTKAAYTAKKIDIKNNSIVQEKNVTTPMMFYSRPKGTYVGKNATDRVMLDFYMVNAELGRNYKVKAEINGTEHMIDTWQPYFIDGLPMGENEVKLTLLDGKGNVADVPLNPVSRKFTLKVDPTE